MNSNFTINVCVANVYRDGDFDSPVVTQALLGESCPILDEAEKWVLIRQNDGYEGWVNRFYGVESTNAYLSNMTCDDISGTIFTDSELSTPVRTLTFGARIKTEDKGQVWLVTLPDGVQGWTQCRLRERPHNPSREAVVSIARKFLGVQYLWGGKSPRGFDCSGLIQTIFNAVGISLPRDSQDQSTFFLSQKIEREKAQAGDLHFFGHDGKVTHVALGIGGGQYIHSQGWVKEESFVESHPNYNSVLSALYLHTVSTDNVHA